LTETPEVIVSGDVTSGPRSPLMFSGPASESYTTCEAKKVKKGTFTESAVYFE
jgi:hypothetical protein